MPKAILEFNLPEDRDAHLLAIHGINWYAAIHTLAMALRSIMKHEDLTEEQYQCYDRIREKLYEAMNDVGVNFDMVE